MSFSDKVKSAIGHPIRDKFRETFKTYIGDQVLSKALSKILSQPGIASKAYGEADIFLIKGALFLSGVRLDESACEGIGTLWKEDLGQRHYDPDAGFNPGHPRPYAIFMPHGFYLPLNFSSKSPFVLRQEKETLYLYLGELRLFPIEFEKVPSYYSLTTSAGIPMKQIGPHRLKRQVLIEYNAYCHFFSEKKECLFCGIISERAQLPCRYKKYFAASPGEVAEVIEAAYKDGASEMQITGGVLPSRAEVEYILETGKAIKERLGEEIIPGSQANMVPPPASRGIVELKGAGWQGVAFNLEVWDERLWPGIAPGKASLMSRERWLEALEYAVEVFGKGNVASAFVAGLEPKQSYLAGVEWLAKRGIYGVPIPWAPAPGSALEGHQTPTASWHVEVAARTLDIWEKYGLNADRHSSGGLHYEDLARMRSNLKREEGALTKEKLFKDPRYILAVEGRIPET